MGNFSGLGDSSGVGDDAPDISDGTVGEAAGGNNRYLFGDEGEEGTDAPTVEGCRKDCGE